MRLALNSMPCAILSAADIGMIRSKATGYRFLMFIPKPRFTRLPPESFLITGLTSTRLGAALHSQGAVQC